MKFYKLLLLSLFTYPSSLCNIAILIVLLPIQITNLGYEENKGTILGITISIASIIAVIFYPIIGYKSDRLTNSHMGRRIPFMLFGIILLCFSCGILALGFHLLVIILGLMLWQLSYSFFTGPYYSLMPDITPINYWGTASGWIGLFTLFGYLSGSLFSFAIPHVEIYYLYMILIGIIIVSSLLPFLIIREPIVYDQVEALRTFKDWVSAFESPNYRYVYMMRFFMSISVFLVQQYIQYYVKDVVESYVFLSIKFSTAEEVTGIVLLLILSGGMFSSVIAGKLSDKIPRQRLVYFGSIIQILSTIGLMLFPNLILIIPGAILFGIGYGAYNTADFALAADVMPDSHYRARDFGIWHSALSLPSTIITPLAGLLLDELEKFSTKISMENDHKNFHLGYIVLFLLSIFFSLASMISATQLDLQSENDVLSIDSFEELKS